jgi:hypothetical protein
MNDETVMAKQKSAKRKNELQDRWRITWMGQWDQDYVNEELEGFFKFGPGGHGDFQFGYVQGSIDHRMTSREEKPAVEFSWEGGDAADCTPLTGRGWAVLEGEELNGLIYIHCGDESEFTASRTTKR